MNFALTEEHLMIRNAARDFAHNELLPGVIERDENQIFPKEQVKKLSELGFLGMMVRKNALIMFMCIELMLNAVNLTFITASNHLGLVDGQIAVFFVLVVAAAEVVVGLAIIVSIFKKQESASVDMLSSSKG